MLISVSEFHDFFFPDSCLLLNVMTFIYIYIFWQNHFQEFLILCFSPFREIALQVLGKPAWRRKSPWSNIRQIPCRLRLNFLFLSCSSTTAPRTSQRRRSLTSSRRWWWVGLIDFLHQARHFTTPGWSIIMIRIRNKRHGITRKSQSSA